MYNGWTNYETWKVSLEIATDYLANYDGEITEEELKSYVEEVAYDGVMSGSFAVSCVTAILSAVNYYEIVELHNERVRNWKEENLIKIGE